MEVGDRVRFIATHGKQLVGKEGYVITIRQGRKAKYGVEFDKALQGHACGIKGKKYGHCYWCFEGELEVIEK